MKELHIECAGAGKTYGIAKKSIEILGECPEHKKIYIITYTNYAVSQIKNEIKKHNHEIPKNIIIDTIHGFLLNSIIYPFSNYIKGTPISSCSIEKLSSDIRFKNLRIKKLKSIGVIHSSEVLKYAKSILVKQSSDKKADKTKKDIILNYIVSDIFCLFVDEAQDMSQEFFDLIQPILNNIDNYYFVGDPNQAIMNSDCYNKFAIQLAKNSGIQLIAKFESRRIPQSIVPLCNKILRPESQMTSINPNDGTVAYILLSELINNNNVLFICDKFSYIKGKTKVFSTDYEKKYIPKELEDILKQKFPSHDCDAIKYVAQAYISKYGLKVFFKNFEIEYDNKLYAIISTQFGKPDNKSLQVDSIHKIKGLEEVSAHFIICNSLFQILIGNKNNYDKETNLLYVALTRCKERLLIIIDDDDNMNDEFLKNGINVEDEMLKLNISKAVISEWQF